VAQAFARIATDRNVQATFLHREGDTATARFALARPNVAAAFSHVRGGLREVGVNGTASGLAGHLQSALKQPVVVMTKTGTLNEATSAGRLKSLGIAVGLPTTNAQSSPLRCGLVAVSYFEFADRWQRGGARASLPRVHLDFAEGPFAGVLARHWSRVARCAPPVKVANAPPPSMVSK
jgi:hypothetical protein